MSNISDIFRRMADAIDANGERPFGGAMVIIAPTEQEGEANQVVDVLLLDATRNPYSFWGYVSGKVESILREVKDADRRGQAFGQRR